jgi:NAD(P)-dependent dehydrogenase (short-subunit alcohol dehydrogenase family)
VTRLTSEPGPGTLPSWLTRGADAVLEASVAGSFSRIGFAVRSRVLSEFIPAPTPALAGRVVLITGATSGLGLAAATELARRSATMYFLARDRPKAARAQRQIITASGNTDVRFGLADLNDLDSVRAFARSFRASYDRLDVLIHNAGAIHRDYATNDAGIELTAAGQVVAPFVLTRLLLSRLRAAAPSRVITIASGGMYAQRLDLAGLQQPSSRYHGVTAYARAKRAQVALSREWARRMAETGVAFHAMHPGWADTPGIAAALPGFRRFLRPVLRSPEQGADTIVWLATAQPELLGSGRFWHDRRPRTEYLFPWTREDPETAATLWDRLARPSRSQFSRSGSDGQDPHGRA